MDLPRAVRRSDDQLDCVGVGPERMAAVAPNVGVGDFGQRALPGRTLLGLPDVGYEAPAFKRRGVGDVGRQAARLDESSSDLLNEGPE